MNNDGIAFGDGLESMREADTVILRFSVYMLSFPLRQGSQGPCETHTPSVRLRRTAPPEGEPIRKELL